MPASSISDFGSISDQVGIYASMKFLMETRRSMILYRFGEEEDIPKGNSTTITWRRWLDLAPALAPIQGSVTPSGEELTYVDIPVTVRQYGKWVPIPKYIEDTVRDPVLNRAIDRLSYNMKLTYETITFNTLRLGGSVNYANGVAGRSSVVDVVSENDIRTAVVALRSDDVEPFSKIISPNVKIATEPVEEAYFATVHSHLEKDIRDLTGFIHVSEYPSRTNVMPGEIGSYESVRFIRHNISVPWGGAGGAVAATIRRDGSNNADVYPILIFGKGAFGCTKLAGTEFNRILVHNAKVEGTDPLAQRGSAGWIGWYACRILEDSYYVRLEVAASA